jgi:hypothetical protein
MALQAVRARYPVSVRIPLLRYLGLPGIERMRTETEKDTPQIATRVKEQD